MGLYGSKFERAKGYGVYPEGDEGLSPQQKAKVLVKATQALDLDKIFRQLKAVKPAMTSEKRVQMVTEMESIYTHFDLISLQNAERVDERSLERQVDAVETHLRAFKRLADELSGWQVWSGAKLPRPFGRPSLERLFWQASKMIGKGGKPAVQPQPRSFDVGWK